jgi:hypothetical protein
MPKATPVMEVRKMTKATSNPPKFGPFSVICRGRKFGFVSLYQL